MSKTTAPPATAVARFERALDELEQLVQKMEKGEQSLDESLAAYERGVALYRECQKALEQAEQRVRLLADPTNPAAAEDFKPHGG
ncbi:MAG: exodeoxyribonuclease VII small subunit [Frankiaceae bacterium]|nr:exodeoxyribonuclease VII small subunit [Arenimonas sp.]